MTTSTASENHSDFLFHHHVWTPQELSRRADELKIADYIIDGLIPQQGIRRHHTIRFTLSLPSFIIDV
jgi:hypothetical protein